MRLAAPRVAAVIRSSAEGARHRARGTGNQDAVAVDSTAHGGVVAAVADGHSDPRCTRARRGADLAVTAAVAAASDPGDHLGVRFVARWRRLVDEDRARDTADGLQPRLAYGTTALLCRCDPSGVTLVQVGDGDIVLVDRVGTASRPLRPRLPVVPAGGTASMADEDVLSELVEVRIPLVDAPRIVLLSTDGVDNAYPSESALLQAAEDMADRLARGGPMQLQQDVDQWVARAAEASGDDASAAVLVLAGRHGS